MQPLSLEQVSVALAAADYAFSVHEEQHAVTLGFHGRIAVMIEVEDGNLVLQALVLEPPGGELRTVLEYVNEASMALHSPQAVVRPSDEGHVICYEERITLPAAPTMVVAALIHNFLRGALGHERRVTALFAALTDVEVAISELTGSDGAAP